MQKQAFYRLSCFSEDVKVVVLIFFEDLLLEGRDYGVNCKMCIIVSMKKKSLIFVYNTRRCCVF